jgi:glycosyltransferase involved in cell wall biosynthesis
VVKNVVDSRPFNDPKKEVSRKRTLLFIGRMVPSKGLLDVIRALAIVASDSTDLTLVCVGDGPDREEGEKLVHSLGLNALVTFTGQISENEAVRYYQESLALVLPSRTEGFSMSIFQAVAAGLPVITTRIRAAADYLREPDNCLWVEPGNPGMIAEKISHLLRNPKLRESMWVNNKKLALDFSAPRIVPEYLMLYQNMLGRN